jgi:hypothetical protein
MREVPPLLSERELDVLGLAGPFKKPTGLSRLIWWFQLRRDVKAVDRMGKAIKRQWAERQ